MYKIRINCTSEPQLLFNGKKIKNKKNNIILKLQPDKMDYISSVIILHKSIKKCTLKSFEILCNYKITEMQFMDLIERMKQIGFYSKDKRNTIQFISIIDNEVIYNYYFKSASPATEEIKKKSNRYRYSQEYLYTKI
jgi:hypothetical protein